MVYNKHKFKCLLLCCNLLFKHCGYLSDFFLFISSCMCVDTGFFSLSFVITVLMFVCNFVPMYECMHMCMHVNIENAFLTALLTSTTVFSLLLIKQWSVTSQVLTCLDTGWHVYILTSNLVQKVSSEMAEKNQHIKC